MYGLSKYGLTRFGTADTITQDHGYGTHVFGIAKYGSPDNDDLINLLTHFKHAITIRGHIGKRVILKKNHNGKKIDVMRFYKPSQPYTDRQQIQRNRLISAVHGWHTMDNNDKQTWNNKKETYKKSGYSIWIGSKIRDKQSCAVTQFGRGKYGGK